MFSRSIDKWSSPRPDTLYPSVVSIGSTLRPTLTSNSLSNLSFKCLVVTNLPLFPANGESLTKKFIDKVGSSMCIISIGNGLSALHIVSPIDISAIPATTTISPA